MKRMLLLLLAIAVALPAAAQYTDQQAFDELGGAQEFARRRAELAKQIKTGYAVLFAKRLLPEGDHYREDNDFYYFTGISDPGAVLVIDVANNRTVLFEPEQNAGTRRTYGFNLLSLPPDQREKYGIAMVQSLNDLDGALAGMIGRGEPDLWLRLGYPDRVDGARREVARDYATEMSHPLGSDAPGDRAAFKRLRDKFPAAHQRDMTPMIDAMREIKTPQEQAILRKVARISAEGQRRAIARVRPGMYEYEVEAEAAYWFRKNGSQGVAYPAIVGSGAHGNIWHYFANRGRMESGDVVVFDFAADLHHMTMDITRTFPAGGKFTPEQAKYYRAVLKAQKAIIAAMRPGITYEEAGKAGLAAFEEVGQGAQARPFCGHSVGLATHDVNPTRGMIKVGHVLTCEPIIDLPELKMHFRIEDTILITENGAEVLTSGVPKELEEIEKLVGSEK